MVLRLLLLLGSVAFTTVGCSPRPIAPIEGRFEVVAQYPHDPDAYTQGLFMDGDRLYESTGLYGLSTLREVDLASGDIVRRLRLPDTVFGEGSVRLGSSLWMLTWRERKAYRIDPDTFVITATNRWDGEGWGLTTDGQSLILSDGTSTLYWIDPASFTVIRRTSVTENDRPVINLNELEFIDGHLYANVYMQDHVVRIDPDNGRVTARYGFTALRTMLPQPNRAEALNGLAWRPQTGTLLVTGKNWPLLFEVRLIP